MLETAYHWETISKNKKISIKRMTALVILNAGDVPFTITGRDIMPGKEYRFPVDSSFSDYNQDLVFKNEDGVKLAVIEYKHIIKQELC